MKFFDDDMFNFNKKKDSDIEQVKESAVVKSNNSWTGDNTGFFDRKISGMFNISDKNNFDLNMKNLFKKTKSKVSMHDKATMLLGKRTKKQSDIFNKGFFKLKNSKSKNFSNMVNMYMPKTKKSNMKIFSPMKITGLNMSGEKMAWKNVNKVIGLNTEKTARKRLKEQSMLNPLGDFDNDKLVNMLDCQPFNPNAQGVLNKLTNWVRGRGFKEDSDIQTTQKSIDNVEVDVGDSSVEIEYKQNNQMNNNAYYTPVQETYRELDAGKDEMQPEQNQSFLKNLIGEGKKIIIKKIQDRRAEKQAEKKAIKKAKQEGKIAGIKYLEEQKYKQTAKDEYDKQRKAYENFWKTRYKKDILRKQKRDVISQVASVPGRALQESARAVSIGTGITYPGVSALKTSQLTGLTINPYGIYRSVGGMEDIPYDVKIDAWFGEGDKLKSYMMQKQAGKMPSRPIMPVMPVQPSQPVQQPVNVPASARQSSKRIPPEPGLVWSEKSKRWVKYKRKPYKK